MTLGPLRFTNAVGGTSDWVYPGPAIDLQSPASAQAVDGATYLIYAESFDRSQWEIATGAYTASSGTFARTTIIANSLGTTAKISFGNPPQIAVYDSGIILPSYKVVQFTRVLSLASGNQSITGIGFRPRLIQFQTGISGGSGWTSSGQSDGTVTTSVELAVAPATFLGVFPQGFGIQRQDNAGSNFNTFVVATFDADGFTLAFTKVGAPTATASINAICYR
jgi:hypothetical protein